MLRIFESSETLVLLLAGFLLAICSPSNGEYCSTSHLLCNRNISLSTTNLFSVVLYKWKKRVPSFLNS